MSDGVLVRLAPENLLVRKNARFTHDRMNFHHDVRGKRFNAHGESHNMEKTISKDHVAEKPRRGWDLWRFASLIPSGCRLPPIHKARPLKKSS